MTSVTGSSLLRFKFCKWDVRSRDRVGPDQVSGQSQIGHQDDPFSWEDGPYAKDRHGNYWELQISPTRDCNYVSLFIRKLEHWEDRHQRRSASGIARSLGYRVHSNVSIYARGVFIEHVLQDWQTTGFEVRLKKDLVHHCQIVNYAARGNAQSSLSQAEGELIIEMTVEDSVEKTSSHLPLNPIGNNLIQMLESGRFADAFFQVEEIKMPVHRLILEASAPVLASFFQDSATNKTVQINGISPEVFTFLLQYIYGGQEPATEFLQENYKDVIDASDRYGITGLKLKTEDAVISSLSIDQTNVVEFILFADQKNCSLLKDFAISVFVAWYDDVFYSDSFLELAKSPRLMKELVVAVGHSRTLSASADVKSSIPINLMSVNQLIEELIKRGLNCDGTKEMLISRLTEATNAE